MKKTIFNQTLIRILFGFIFGFIPVMIGMFIAKRFISWISANPDKIPNVIIGGFVFIIVSCILGKITKKVGNKHKKNNIEHKAD